MKIFFTLVLVFSNILAQQTIKDLTVNDFKVVSTSKGSKPCPAMTATQMNAIASPQSGLCVFNTSSNKLNIYNGTIWKAAGGGVESWATSTAYSLDDIVIQSNKIYKCVIAHTSGVFATDLSASRWVEVSSVNLSDANGTLSIANGGTGSTTKNFVDLTTSQTIAGDKTFSDGITMSSTSKAFLPPRLTTSQKEAIASPSVGMVVFDTTIGKLSTYNGSSWASVGSSADQLLLNGDMENIATSWTVTGATATANTSDKIEGARATSLSLSSTLSFTQSVSSGASSLAGLQGVASGYVKTSLSDVSLCSMINGAEDKCVMVVSNNSWRQVQIPIVFGATSSGIKVKTTSSASGVVLVDGFFLGLSTPFQDVSGARVWGTAQWIGSTSCVYSVASTTYVTPSTNASCNNPTVSGNLTVPTTKTTKLSGYWAAGDYIVQTSASQQVGGTASEIYIRVSGANVASQEYYHPIRSNGSDPVLETSVIKFTVSSSFTGDIDFQFKSSAGTTGWANNVATSSINSTVTYFPPPVKIYSQASQDYDWTAYTPTFTGFGTVSSSSCFHKRKGSDLLLRCNFTSGVTTATEARISLPSGLSTANSSLMPSLSLVGKLNLNFSSTTYFSSNTILAEPSASYLTIGRESSTSQGLAKQNGNVIAASGDAMSFFASVPISGWQDYGVVVGSFQGVPSVPDVGANRVDTFTASYAANSSINTNCSSGSCFVDQIGAAVSSISFVSTGNYLVSFPKTYLNVKCFASVSSSTNQVIPNGAFTCKNCNSITITTNQRAAGSAENSYGSIFCMGSY